MFRNERKVSVFNKDEKYDIFVLYFRRKKCGELYSFVRNIFFLYLNVRNIGE